MGMILWPFGEPRFLCQQSAHPDDGEVVVVQTGGAQQQGGRSGQRVPRQRLSLTWTQLPCVNSSCFPSFLKAFQFNHVQSCSVVWLQAITWHHLASLGHASDLWSLCFCLLDFQVVRPQKAPWAPLRKLFKHVHTTKHGLLLLVSQANQAIDGCRWLLAILLSQQGNHTPNLSHPFLSKIGWLLDYPSSC